MKYFELQSLLEGTNTLEEKIEVYKRYYNCTHPDKIETGIFMLYRSMDISCLDCKSVKTKEAMNELG